MKSSGTTLFTAILALSAVGALSAESINPPTMPQTAPMNKQEKKNLDMVLEWWRVVIQGGHLDQTSKYQAEDYIQHNPNVNTGRAGFVEFFSKFSKPKNPIPDKTRQSAGGCGSQGRLRVAHLGNGIKGSARSIEVLPFQQLRRAPYSKRQGPGALGQRDEDARLGEREHRRVSQASVAMEYRQALQARET